MSEPTVSVLLSPDGYEMVVPVFDKSFKRVNAFVGVDTARTYAEAKVREDQEASNVKIRLLKMSNWPQIVKWFSIYPDQGERLNLAAVNWMLGVAERVRSYGFDSESIVDLETVNMAIERDME